MRTTPGFMILILAMSTPTAFATPADPGPHPACSALPPIIPSSAISAMDPVGQTFAQGWHFLPEPYTHITLNTVSAPAGGDEYSCTGISWRQVITEVRSPGDATIRWLNRTTFLASGRESYDISLNSLEKYCSYIHLRIGQLRDLDRSVQSLINGWVHCQTHTVSGGQIETCRADLQPNPDLLSGQLIGSIGGGTGTGGGNSTDPVCQATDTRGIDFHVGDERNTNPFEEPGYYQSNPLGRLHAICPISVFQAPAPADNYTNMTFNTLLPSAERCGSISHDVVGTAAGNWFEWDAPMPAEGTNVHQLALVRHHYTGDWVFSFNPFTHGGTTTSGNLYTFPVDTSGGYKNRNFDAVIPGQAYCYDTLVGEVTSSPYPIRPVPQRLLILLTTDGWLYFQEQNNSGTCGTATNWSFTTEPVYYFRRTP